MAIEKQPSVQLKSLGRRIVGTTMMNICIAKHLVKHLDRKKKTVNPWYSRTRTSYIEAILGAWVDGKLELRA